MVGTYWDVPGSGEKTHSRDLASTIAGYADADREAKRETLLAFFDFCKIHLRKGSRKGSRTSRHARKQTPSVVAGQAETLLRKGHMSRAAATLLREECPVPEDATNLLRGLHPAEDAPLPLPHVAVNGLSGDELLAVCSKACKGKAPGPSGWTEELLAKALRHSPSARHNMAAIMTDVLNGAVDPAVAVLLRRCRLVPIGKPSGGVRPLAIGEAFVRIAARIALDAHLAALNAKFGVVQAALASGGVERAIHDLRAAYSAGHVIVALDCNNAFNCLRRAATREVLLANPDCSIGLWNLWSLLYCVASDLLLASGEQLASSSGVRQGDVLGPALFALSIKTCWMRLSRCSRMCSSARTSTT